MANEYTDLLLVDADGAFFVVSYPKADAKAGDMVRFCNGSKQLIGLVVRTEYVQVDSKEWAFIEALQPIYPALKVWTSTWEASDMGD